MKVTKKQSLDKNKKTIGELYGSLSNDGKSYDDYYYGNIIYENGEYTFEPTGDDEVYTEEEKRNILENMLEDTIHVPHPETPMDVTKENPMYLDMHSVFRTNMYGGIRIVSDEE